MIKIKHLTESLNRKYSIEKQPKKLNEEYSLVGQDGNAFSLMGYTARCMKECGLRDEIDEMRKLAMSGDYYNLIAVCDEYIQKCNEINPDIDESLNENLQDTLDKIIDNYNYYKNRNNAGLLSIKEEGLKAFEEFSIKYPVFKKALQSKIKDDFEKDLVKSNIGLAVQSTGLLNESLNESVDSIWVIIPTENKYDDNLDIMKFARKYGVYNSKKEVYDKIDELAPDRYDAFIPYEIMTESLNEANKAYKKCPRKRIDFEDDIVIVYDDNDKIMYKGLEDYEPMKYENWEWDEETKSYVLGKYRKICLDS